MSAKSVRRFAPLASSTTSGDPVLRGIIFDMDGTLCEPQNYMFKEMRDALSITKSTDILDHIQSLPEPQQSEAHAKIEAIERRAMKKQVAQPGLDRLLEYLDSKGIPKAICTRNFDMPVNHLLTEHVSPHVKQFSPVITRAFKPPKPSPAGILHIANAWGVEPVDKEVTTASGAAHLPLIMVGDSVDDIVAGYDAGAATVLLRSPGKEELEAGERTHVVIDRLDDLVDILDGGFTGR